MITKVITIFNLEIITEFFDIFTGNGIFVIVLIFTDSADVEG